MENKEYRPGQMKRRPMGPAEAIPEEAGKRQRT